MSARMTPSAEAEAAERIEGHGLWYHTIDVAPGLSTPGWFDTRHVLDLLPWPDVAGKRCLDIGTYDGFFAFEMERRGAAEVVAVDIPDHTLWDWPAEARPDVVGQRDLSFLGPPKGSGFALLAELQGSRAEWRAISIYDLDPGDIGTFDVVVCGSLLLHLRDPIRALEAVRRVCRGWFLSCEQIELLLTVIGRRWPLYRLDGTGELCQWWVPNSHGHERMLWSAGFEVESRSRPYVERFNVHPPDPDDLRTRIRHAAMWALTGDRNPGVLHRAALARPRL
jgi:tRNA (mo5U34)-methyltransferase